MTFLTLKFIFCFRENKILNLEFYFPNYNQVTKQELQRFSIQTFYHPLRFISCFFIWILERISKN